MASHLLHRYVSLSHLALFVVGAGLFTACSSDKASTAADDDATSQDDKSAGGGSKTSRRPTPAREGAEAALAKPLPVGAEAALEEKSSAAGGDNSDAAGGKSGAAGSSAKGGAGGAAGKGASGAAGKAAAGELGRQEQRPGWQRREQGDRRLVGQRRRRGNPPPQGTGGTATGGGTTGNAVPGYWTSKEWHGCSWTGVGEKGASTITPKDFTQNAAGAPYCAKGTVGKDPPSGSYTGYEGVALVGFNISEASPASCVSTPVDKTKEGPPAVSKMQGTGIAANIVKPDASNNNFTFRVRIQGPKGHMNGTDGANNRWCTPITKTQGKVFIPYRDFWTECWGETDSKKGKRYNGDRSTPLFHRSRKGRTTCLTILVNGFAYGNSERTRRTALRLRPLRRALLVARAKHTRQSRESLVDGEEYIIQNNNWGQTSRVGFCAFTANSFKMTSATGRGTPRDAPGSFPWIFIGANGNPRGQYATTSTDNFPRKISEIETIMSTFQYSGTTGTNTMPPTTFGFPSPFLSPAAIRTQRGFVMIWLREPRDAQPIGTKQGSISIANKTWNIWVGTRGGGGLGTSRPLWCRSSTPWRTRMTTAARRTSSMSTFCNSSRRPRTRESRAVGT